MSKNTPLKRIKEALRSNGGKHLGSFINRENQKIQYEFWSIRGRPHVLEVHPTTEGYNLYSPVNSTALIEDDIKYIESVGVETPTNP